MFNPRIRKKSSSSGSSQPMNLQHVYQNIMFRVIFSTKWTSRPSLKCGGYINKVYLIWNILRLIFIDTTLGRILCFTLLRGIHQSQLLFIPRDGLAHAPTIRMTPSVEYFHVIHVAVSSSQSTILLGLDLVKKIKVPVRFHIQNQPANAQ